MSKSDLRKLIKGILKSIPVELKARQSKTMSDFLLNHSPIVKSAKHIALYLPMKGQELDITALLEGLLSQNDKRVYVPHVLGPYREDMCFFELKSLDEYRQDMNVDNKFGLRQFNEPDMKIKVDSGVFDLVLVPGLVFEIDSDSGKGVRRLGRGKGYYDAFLKGLGDGCRSLAIGFNEQCVGLNEELNGVHVPMGEDDVWVEAFLCSELIGQIKSDLKKF